MEMRRQIDDGERAWRVVWRGAYMVVRRLGPIVRMVAASGFADAIVELRLVGRRSGEPRSVIVTLIQVDDAWYVGHPNGWRSWLANLESAQSVELALPRGGSIDLRAVPLDLGPERDAVIRATRSQQPWPGSLLYRAAHRHILRAGIYYRLELLEVEPSSP